MPNATVYTSPLDAIAEQYVRLVLSVGCHDKDYVDAYYGPPAWKTDIERTQPSLASITSQAETLLHTITTTPVPADDPSVLLRREYLARQTAALAARARLLQGSRMLFDDEAQALYDVTPPSFAEEHFEHLLANVGSLLPGTGEIPDRYQRFLQDFVIPKDRLDRVFTAAIAEGRRQTVAWIPLPEREHFAVEYVTDKPWSGYNWYQGGGKSLIQVNSDFPITIDRAVDLACHEGYPGHHVYNTLLEHHLVRGRGWMEFAVYALFSPQSMIAEGTANFGIAMALPGPGRVAFERDTLFPLAGLDPTRAGEYYRVHAVVQQLAYAGNEAARRYLDGLISREEAAAWLTRYALMSPDRALQRTRFFDTYRSYVINYNVGQDLVRKYVEARGGTPENLKQRWTVFAELLSTPRVPSGLLPPSGLPS